MEVKIDTKSTLNGDHSIVNSKVPASESYAESMALRQDALIQSLSRSLSVPKEIIDDSIGWRNFIDAWKSGNIPHYPGITPVDRDQIDKEVSKALDAIKNASLDSPVETIIIDSISLTGGNKQ